MCDIMNSVRAGEETDKGEYDEGDAFPSITIPLKEAGRGT